MLMKSILLLEASLAKQVIRIYKLAHSSWFFSTPVDFLFLDFLPLGGKDLHCIFFVSSLFSSLSASQQTAKTATFQQNK